MQNTNINQVKTGTFKRKMKDKKLRQMNGAGSFKDARCSSRKINLPSGLETNQNEKI